MSATESSRDPNPAIEELVEKLDKIKVLDDRLIALKGKVLRNLAGRINFDGSIPYLLRAVEHQLDVLQMRDSGDLSPVRAFMAG